MSKKFWIIALFIISALAVSMTALAVGPRFLGIIVFTDNGATLRARGSIGDLRNLPIRVLLTATGIASVECVSPEGDVVPGQRTTVTSTGADADIRPDEGLASFMVTTAVPGVDADVACPEPGWMARVTNVDFTSARVDVHQPSSGGPVILSRTVVF